MTDLAQQDQPGAPPPVETVAAGTGTPAAESSAPPAPKSADRIMREGKRLAVRSRRALTRSAASARAALGPSLGRLRPWLERQTRRAGVRARVFSRALGRFVTARVVPAAEDVGQRLREWTKTGGQRLRQRSIDAGRRLRERLRPQVLRQDYRRAQLFAHRVLFDRSVERLLFAPSQDRIPLGQLRIQSLMRLSGRDYRPTPRLVFEWAMAAIPEPVKHFVFVDFGAGVGRVLLLASQFEFDKVYGVEFAEELQEDCTINIAQYPRSLMKCRQVECVHDDATHFEIPEQDCVLYFFNPFGENVLREVMARVARSYDRNPRRIYVVCVDLPSIAAIEEWRIFERVPIDRNLDLRIRAFSPYPIVVYRSIQ